MKTRKLLDKAIQIAASAHAGQFDKGGMPYLMHPIRVMSFLKSNDEELQCIAIMHDVLEDSSVTAEDLLAAGMTQRIVAGVQCLTKIKGESYDNYKLRVLASTDAMQVKLADLRHNSDIRRLKGVTQKDVDRIAKYHTFFLEISDRLSTAHHYA